MRDWLLEVTALREADAFDRAIDLRITRLRRKVEIDPAHPEAIRGRCAGSAICSSRRRTEDASLELPAARLGLALDRFAPTHDMIRRQHSGRATAGESTRPSGRTPHP